MQESPASAMRRKPRFRRWLKGIKERRGRKKELTLRSTCYRKQLELVNKPGARLNWILTFRCRFVKPSHNIYHLF
jgi:hypothetical protein